MRVGEQAHKHTEGHCKLQRPVELIVLFFFIIWILPLLQFDLYERSRKTILVERLLLTVVSSKCPISQCQYSAAASTDTGSARLDTPGLATALKGLFTMRSWVPNQKKNCRLRFGLLEFAQGLSHIISPLLPIIIYLFTAMSVCYSFLRLAFSLINLSLPF